MVRRPVSCRDLSGAAACEEAAHHLLAGFGNGSRHGVAEAVEVHSGRGKDQGDGDEDRPGVHGRVPFVWVQGERGYYILYHILLILSI